MYQDYFLEQRRKAIKCDNADDRTWEKFIIYSSTLLVGDVEQGVKVVDKKE